MRSLHLFLTCVALACASSAFADPPAPVDFVREVRPIFEQHCFECHGPKTAESGLRLSQRASAFEAADSGKKPIVPGDVAGSRLIQVISGTDADAVKMPPEDEGEPLTAEQVALITRWVTEGANWPADADAAATGPQHWAWVKPVQAKVPEITNSKSELRNPIDAFVASRLQTENLGMSPPADRYTLVRRVHLDLIGLPPTPQAVEEFVNDQSPDAYEKMVDRVLADPAYGERWARVWLDLARYADSKGYGSDPLRTIWRYRDWVIEAFNRNLPYDQFTIEQLAGDLLPSATPEQILATAFHRNTMANDEGGTDDEEFRVAAIKDRAETTAQVWMGLTMGCAKCHTHKFDPITQREYYQFYAFFNQTEDADRGDEEPRIATPSPQNVAEVTRLNTEIATAKARIAEEKAQPQVAAMNVNGRYLRFSAPGPGRLLSLAEVQIFSGGTNVALVGTATQSSTGYGGEPKRGIDNNTDGEYFRGNSVTHTAIENDPWWEVDLGGMNPIERIVVWNRTDGGTHTRLTNVQVQLLDDARKPTWETTIIEPPNPQAELPLAPQSEASKQLASSEKQLAELTKQNVTTPIMRELSADKQRKTHVMLKGNFLNPGDEVRAGLPEAFGPLPSDAAANRLGVARWLVSADNSLTARVAVNRFWSQLFGRGIVETEEDFGTQGVPPTHPELLDWLAVEFRDNLHWDVKQLLKVMVTSATYRQASIASPDLLQRDALNKLHARGPRHRLEAEMVRDQALAISGLLSRKLGGPSVYPPQPDGLWRAAFNGERTWATSTGEDRYRRGLYTTWRRTVPYPSMAAFDAPSREICTLRRMPTNTPLQAFVTLNDPVYVECAQALARRILREASAGNAERAAFGLRLCLARQPQPEQVQSIVKLVESQLANYRANAVDAKAIATEPIGPAPDGADLAELAAWTVAANVLLNLDGVLTTR